MTVQEIIKRVDNIKTDTNYWFVRTDYGAYFEQFIDQKCIAVGWDYITLSELKKLTAEEIKAKIAKKEEMDLNTFRGKIKATQAYNKLMTFVELRKEDIIIIPSRNSSRLAFGRIIDDAPFEDIKVDEFVKRRKVEWFEIKSMDDLNAIFFQVKSNQHTISNINRFSSHIDRVIGNLYKKGENTHYVLNIESEDDINFDDLKCLMDNIKILSNNINKEFEFEENMEDFFIKINLQSKGLLELIRKGRSLAILAYLMHLISCNSLDQERNDKIKGFIDSNRQVLDSTAKVIDTLKINTVELTKPFNNGN